MKTRYLSNNEFKRELRNGECIKREWYSIHHPTVVCTALYVAYCPRKNLPLLHRGSMTGSTVELENGEAHRKCLTAYLNRHKETGSVDSLVLEQHRSEQEYWHKVLTRVFLLFAFLPPEVCHFV